MSSEEVRRAQLLMDAAWAASIGDPEQRPQVDYLSDQVERRFQARRAEAGAEGAPEFDVVTLDEFVAVEEPGAEALVGDKDGAVIPEGGDVMFYGDGGAGKTTLCIDLACHLAAGDDWLGITVARPARVLIVENEGPRPLFRAKLRRKRNGWTGSPLDDRVVVLAEPWGRLSFADPESRDALATKIRKREIDVVIVGPVTRSGMNEAGTLQEVRDFMKLVDQVRESSGRRVAVVLVHHENKGGQVSGAWEASGDTLFHVQAQGHRRIRLYVQKARWASAHHATTLHLLWSDGEGFALEDKPELNDETLAEQILALIAESPGTGCTKIEKAITGIGNDRIRAVRDGLLSAGQVVNVVKQDGREVALDHCPERVAAHLFLAEDPTITHLRRPSGADVAQTAPLWAEGDGSASAPCATPIRRTAVGAEPTAPENSSVGAP
jgi:hypothetical protein